MTSEQAEVNLGNPIIFGRGREKARQIGNKYLTLVTTVIALNIEMKLYSQQFYLENCSYHICNRNPAQLLADSNCSSYFLQVPFSQTPCDKMQIPRDLPKVTSVAFVLSQFARTAVFL